MDATEYFRAFEQPWQPALEARLAAATSPSADWVRARLTEPSNWRERQAQEQAFASALAQASDPELSDLTGLLFPQFPDLAARAYRSYLTQRPYTSGLLRRAFRSAGEAPDTAAAAGWLWNLWQALRAYPQDVTWVAESAGLLSPWESQVTGALLAQAVSDGHTGVFEVLRDTAATVHPVGRMGRHVPAALLGSSRPDAWALARQLLLAAQRQEGLRQVILETVDEAHPDAFPLFLRTVLDEDLLRFAAVLRAAGVWFGLGYDVTDTKTVRRLLGTALEYLDDPAQAQAAVAGAPGVPAYLALFTLGMTDAGQAGRLARPLLTDADPERRMAAAQFLNAAGLLTREDHATLLRDPDLRLGALSAQHAPSPYHAHHAQHASDALMSFEDLAGYARRLPEQARHTPLLFPWLGQVPARGSVTDRLTGLLDTAEVLRVAPHVSAMTSTGKSTLLTVLKRALSNPEVDGALAAGARDLVITLLQDRSSSVSQESVTVMQAARLEPSEADTQILLTLLRRKSADLRRGLIRLLAQDPDRAHRSAQALLASGSTEQRQAGLSLLDAVGLAPPADFQAKNVTEQTLLDKLVSPQSTLSLKDGLGLFDPADLARPGPLTRRDRDYPRDVQRGAALLEALNDLIEQRRETPLTAHGYDGPQTVLLMNVSPYLLRAHADTPMPLADLWDGWWAARPAAQDGDLTRLQWALHHHVNRADTTETELVEELGEQPALEGLLSAAEAELAAPADADEPARLSEATRDALRAQLTRSTVERTLGPRVTLSLPWHALLAPVVAYLAARHCTAADRALQLDAWETALTFLPLNVPMLVSQRYSWRQEDPRDLLDGLRCEHWSDLTPVQFRQYWNTLLHENTAFPALPAWQPPTGALLRAVQEGLAGRADLLNQLIGPRPGDAYPSHAFRDLEQATARTIAADRPTSPEWEAAAHAVRDRVLETELQRGDLETPATSPALALSSVHGADVALRLLAGLGRNPLKRGYQGSSQSRDATFSHLLRVSYPAPTDTAASVGALARTLGLSEGRLLDLAMFAPQWAHLIAGTLGWKGLTDGVYWLHAHTKDSHWSVPQEVRDAWEGEISGRTPLKAADLTEGAVDVAWFHRTYRALGRARFHTLLEASRYASSGAGHKRAELFAAAILGEVTEAELLGRIRDKRNQDAVRSLGLLPLGRGRKAQQTLEARYRVLAQFRREARQFGAQRQASDRLAADIGMQNLARTAGYADPQRLMWAMEARTAPDWQAAVTVDGVTVQAHVNAAGEAALTVTRGEKALKALPPALRKHPEVTSLREAVKELDATRRRMRLALEEAMVRGDLFQPQELRDLARHPVIAPMLRDLVWVMNEQHLGHWQEGTLHTLDGPVPITDQALRVAHPHDLFTGGQWRAHQADLLDRQVTQPFKQVFREYYPITPAEQGAQRSARYAGHHVQPGKAAALLKARGWVSVPGEGTRKTDHREGITAWLDDSLGYGTPNEVEGMPLHAAGFIRRDEWTPMPLAEVPPRLFSETMRDLDLVVSVAHVGGVDPEASQSTVEMRESLLQETLRLLKLGNVRLEHQHALIDGAYSRYTVHLGSGTVHRQPGGYLCIVPVHNAQQGRVFLPFADPDPRTAEVVSKVLLLAEDRKIQDPTILEQLR